MNTSPTYIVTGATGGIGRAIVEELTRNHAPCQIILAVRDTRRGEEIAIRHRSAHVEIDVIPLDLARMSSVKRFAGEIRRSGIPITALINNAGTMPPGVTITEDGMEIATQTNFVATALLTLLLEPVITDSGAIVFTTSVTRHICRLRRDWRDLAIKRHQRFVTYGRSKLMITHFALEMATRLASRGIRVNCCDPGAADTGMIRLGHPVIDRLADMLVRPLIHTPAQGAAAALRAAFAQSGGRIFTYSSSCPMPRRWPCSDSHLRLIDDLFSTLRNFS